MFVVPGPITHPNFRGANDLIRQGAELVTKPDDILAAYGMEKSRATRERDGGVTRARARAAEKEYRTRLVGAAPLQLIGQALHEVRRDLHGGIGLPLTKYRFFAQRRQIGNADKLPFRLRAHVDQRSILLFRQHGVGIFD